MISSIERKQTTSSSLAETLTWIAQNPHHHGYWTHAEKFLVLEGEAAELWIPVEIHVPGMMEADDFEETGRMYRPSEAGRVILASQIIL